MREREETGRQGKQEDRDRAFVLITVRAQRCRHVPPGLQGPWGDLSAQAASLQWAAGTLAQCPQPHLALAHAPSSAVFLDSFLIALPGELAAHVPSTCLHVWSFGGPQTMNCHDVFASSPEPIPVHVENARSSPICFSGVWPHRFYLQNGEHCQHSFQPVCIQPSAGWLCQRDRKTTTAHQW